MKNQMKSLTLAVVLLLGGVSVGWAAPPAPLTTLRAIHALTNAEAARQLPVAFEATVTYYRNYEGTLFVQDKDAAIYVHASHTDSLRPGDRVLIKGTTRPSFRPTITPSSITVLRHGDLPKPLAAGFGELISGDHDCQLVSVRGTVRAAGVVLTQSELSTRLKVLTGGGLVSVNLDATNATAAEDLLDAEVEITGVTSGTFDSKMQMTGVLLHVSSLADVKVLDFAKTGPWALPITPMDRILTLFSQQDRDQRVRVQGTITYYQAGTAVVLQDGSRSLWINIMADTSMPLRIGDQADATGFPDVENGFLMLSDGEVRDNQVQASITPPLLTWAQLSAGAHIYDLVSTEGEVVTEVREGNQDEYVLRAGDKLFSAIYGHPFGMIMAPMKQVPLGARVRVTGICIRADSNPWDQDVPFNIMLRSFEDVTVVVRPSLLNVRNLILLVGLLLVGLALVGARGWSLERKVRRQTAAMAIRTEAEAALERRRRHILEDINGERALNEILEAITEMVSSTLEGAPCWCEVPDGVRLGDGACPANTSLERDRLRIVDVKIHARTGPPLGTLYAGFAAESAPGAAENEALTVASQLATLAIETGKLYGDLRRRSEFDLLTDIPNRFSLGKRLEAQIGEAQRSSGIFGLIYIDLDKFKPINDTFGHHVGDLFLQAVARRMSRQLLGCDMLARLGGDEFAALVALGNGPGDLEIIQARLQRCFDDPFVIENHTLHGEASFGVALYPEDATTKDSLLSAADAAMYAAKHGKRKTEITLAQQS